MHTITKMLRLEWALFKISAITDLQMRLNLLMQFFNDAGWYVVQIILFESVYLHVTTLGGWGVAEMRVFLGILFLIDGLHMVFFAYNFDHFSYKISRGELDLLLLKPVSTQQLFTAQRFQCGFILNVLLATAWLLWAMTGLPGGIPWSRIGLILLVVPAGLSVFYATRLLFCLPMLLFKQGGDLHELYFTLFRLGLRPDKLYGPGLRYFVLMVLPIAMLASVPTRILLDPFDGWLLAGLCGWALFALLVTNRLWYFALKRYTQS